MLEFILIGCFVLAHKYACSLPLVRRHPVINNCAQEPMSLILNTLREALVLYDPMQALSDIYFIVVSSNFTPALLIAGATVESYGACETFGHVIAHGFSPSAASIMACHSLLRSQEANCMAASNITSVGSRIASMAARAAC